MIKTIRYTLLVISLMTIGFLVAPTVNAIEGSDTSEQRQDTAEKKAREAKERAEAKAREARERATENKEERREEASKRLGDAKRDICENRKQRITELMQNTVTRGQKQIDNLTTISERVQAFYQQKGNTLDTYDALVADVNAKKASAEAALASISERATGFDCAGEDPKGTLGAYKETVKSKIGALMLYRNAVRNLIVEVKSVQSDAKTSEERS